MVHINKPQPILTIVRIVIRTKYLCNKKINRLVLQPVSLVFTGLPQGLSDGYARLKVKIVSCD